MAAHGMGNVVEHGIVHLVHAAGNGLQQPAPTHDGIELEGDAVGLQLFEH